MFMTVSPPRYVDKRNMSAANCGLTFLYAFNFSLMHSLRFISELRAFVNNDKTLPGWVGTHLFQIQPFIIHTYEQFYI